ARNDIAYSNEIQRDTPLVQSLTSVLGLGEAQLDELFTAAAAL
ncbi:hypothetical protein HKBW3S42_02333, partial [Candidatus Hakubella thermalkaliphila]